MSEKDDTGKQKEFETHFIDILDHSEARDVGISSFDQTISEYQDFLTKKFSKKFIVDYAELNETQDALTDLWIYTGSTANISGRLYLSSSTYADMVPDEWGEPQTDSNGKQYYFVNDARLKSEGVEVTVIDNEKGIVSEVKIGYKFSLESEEDDVLDDEQPTFIAYPGELATHTYETPSPAEAELRLSIKWPSEYKLIKQLVKPDLQLALPRRVSVIERRVQEALVSSEEFRSLLEIYLNEYLSLSQAFPYIATADQSIYSFEGDAGPFEAGVEGAWTKVLLNDPLTVVLYTPSIRSFEMNDGTVRLSMTGCVYNEADDTPEYVRFDLESLSHFQSTRAQNSILERVKLITHGETINTLAEEVMSRTTIPVIEGVLTPDTVAQVTVSEKMEKMFMLDNELARVRDIILDAQKVIYDTYEEAFEASSKLVHDDITPRLIGAGLGEDFMFTFSGTSITVPDQVQAKDGVGEKAGVFIYALNEENGLKLLDSGDVLEGKIDTLMTLVKPYEVDGETKGYIVSPTVAARVYEIEKTLSSVHGVEMAHGSVVVKALIPLDGSAEMRIKEVEIHTRVGKLISEAAEEYGKHEIVDTLRLLRKDFDQEVSNKFVALSDLNPLVGIQDQIENIRSRGMKTSIIYDALGGLLIDKSVNILGEVYAYDSLLNTTKDVYEDGSVLAGVVIDVKRIDEKDTFGIVVRRDTGDLAYVPFASITDFRF